MTGEEVYRYDPLLAAPTLEQAAIAQLWTGLRPLSQDGSPILGKVPGWENEVLATGHGTGGF